MRNELPTLYKKDSTGKIRQWSIISEENKFWTEQGTVDGKIVVNKPTITIGVDPRTKRYRRFLFLEIFINSFLKKNIIAIKEPK